MRIVSCHGRPRLNPEGGFSLIELVVVIAVLGVLIAVALPRFGEVRKDGQAAQAKNALATILKECVVAELRDESTTLSDIASAKAKLSGFNLYAVQGQALVPQAQFNSASCFTSSGGRPSGFLRLFVVPDPLTPGGDPLDNMPRFTIDYDKASSNVTRVCQFNQDVSYLAGCKQNSTQPNQCPDIYNANTGAFEPNPACSNLQFALNGTW